jgi:hypothetical protein
MQVKIYRTLDLIIVCGIDCQLDNATGEMI